MNLITIQTLEDNTVARSMMNYPTKSDALGALYSTMASSSASASVVKCVCALMTDNGFLEKTEILDKQEDSDE